MQHRHRTEMHGHKVIVAMGYNAMMKGYFMFIEPVTPNNPEADENTGLIYSNLDDPNIERGITPDIHYFQEKLRAWNIDVPQHFFDRVISEH